MKSVRHINRNESLLEEIKDIAPELIARYLSGIASIDEMNEVLSWLRMSEGNQTLFMSMKRVWFYV